MGGNNHLIRKDSLKVADEIINKPHISILGEVAFNMDANLITFENGKWTEYKRERVGNKISLIEIKVGA